MKKQFQSLAAFPVLALTILACSSSFQVVGTPPSSPVQGNSPTEEATPAPANLLPHAFYYLADGQVFRMERNGKTISQPTLEPVNVTDYDVSPVDGSVAYVAGNQLLLINADGSNCRALVDGGRDPLFSPNGQTLAYSLNGLNLYDLSTGISSLMIEDHPLGGALPPEIYLPEKYSPDGTKLLISIGHPPDGPSTGAIYSPASKTLLQFAGEHESITCCTHYGGAAWSADSSSFHAVARVPDSSSPGGELWKVDAMSGAVTRLIPGGAGDGTTIMFNFPYKPYFAPDGQLYFFFLEYPESSGYVNRAPLLLVRSGADGVTDRTILRPDTFELMNEALWSPDASFVIVAFAPNQDVYDGGRAEIIYLDGRPNLVLTPFAQQLKWGP